MALQKHEVRDLARIAKSVPAVIRDPRYSGVGRAEIAIERAECVAAGLACLVDAMPDDGAAELPTPSKPPRPGLALEAFRYEPAQCDALLKIHALPSFVLSLALS